MLKVYTDAATNTQKSGGGILIISEKQEQLAISLPETNNHQAELAVILHALTNFPCWFYNGFQKQKIKGRTILPAKVCENNYKTGDNKREKRCLKFNQ